jgi:glycosyltransferase involved in cell wall biosynthesis
MSIFVSLCTPTYNRRDRIKIAIECFLHQDYPKNMMEWIIIDDGTDKIKDLVKDIPQVVYVELDEKLSLGEKRNISYQYAKGDIIFNIDDDDYYRKDKVSYTVNEMINNKDYLISGSSCIYNYFECKKRIYKLGPYSKYHASDATLAFWKEYLENNSYKSDKNIALESDFLNKFKNKLLQLDPEKTILVISHGTNTVNRLKLLKNKKRATLFRKRLKDIIDNDEILKMIK